MKIKLLGLMFVLVFSIAADAVDDCKERCRNKKYSENTAEALCESRCETRLNPYGNSKNLKGAFVNGPTEVAGKKHGDSTDLSIFNDPIF